MFGRRIFGCIPNNNMIKNLFDKSYLSYIVLVGQHLNQIQIKLTRFYN